MTGPENYRAAERLYQLSRSEEPGQAAITLQMAQVQATLALTAAVAESGGLAATGAMGIPTSWARAIGGES